VFCTAGNRANTAVLVKYASSTCDTFFRPDTSFFEDTDESGIKAGINRFIGITLGDGLNTCAAADWNNRIISFYCLGGLLDENIVALALDSQFLNLDRNVAQSCRDS
jgi:hypothetical protein